MNNKLIFQSSNSYKISEYKRLLDGQDIEIQNGKDIKEVLSDMDEVIIYKAIEAGENVIVEDTVLFIDGKEEVEIRWKWKDLKTGSHIRWIISIGIVRNGFVEVYRGQTEAIVDRSKGMDGEAFEPFIVPINDNPNKLSYSELAKVIDKDIIDPRAVAVKNLLNDNPTFVQNLKDIPTWNGQYQND